MGAAPRLAGLEVGQHRLDVVDEHEPVAGEVGQHLGELVAVHPLVVGPGAGRELDGERGDDLGGDRVRPGDRDHAADRLEVDQQVAAVEVATQAHQARERRVAEPVRGRRVGAQPPDPALVDGRPRRGRVGARRCEHQVDAVVADGDREDGGQRRALVAAPGGQTAQRGVEASRALPVGADAQGDLCLEGVVGGRPAPAPAALADQGGEQRGGQQAAADEVVARRGSGLVAGGVRVEGRDRVLAVVGRALGSGGRHGRGGGAGHPVETGGVLGHDQHPPGLDQPTLDEVPAVGLRAVLVEPEDVVPATPVAEVPLGDVPEVVVVVPLRRLDDVHLAPDDVGHVAGHARVVHGALLLGGGTGPGDPRVRLRGVRPARDIEARVADPLQDRGRRDVVVGHAGRQRGGRPRAAEHRAADEQGADEGAGELLGPPGERHRPGQPAAAHEADRLDDQAQHELQPGEPHHGPQHDDDRAGRERRGQVGAAGEPGREGRRGVEEHQPDGHADDDREQGHQRAQGAQDRATLALLLRDPEAGRPELAAGSVRGRGRGLPSGLRRGEGWGAHRVASVQRGGRFVRDVVRRRGRRPAARGAGQRAGHWVTAWAVAEASMWNASKPIRPSVVVDTVSRACTATVSAFATGGAMSV